MLGQPEDHPAESTISNSRPPRSIEQQLLTLDRPMPQIGRTLSLDYLWAAAGLTCDGAGAGPDRPEAWSPPLPRGFPHDLARATVWTVLRRVVDHRFRREAGRSRT
jgi:hypothetical protein